MSSQPAQPDAPDAVILAAGKGTRMNSDLAKVLHPVAGRPMLLWVLDACRAVGVRRSVVIVGHQAQQVRQACAGRGDVTFVEQGEQLGTGHAVRQAASCFAAPADRRRDVLVLCGDGPLIRPATLATLLAAHRGQAADATLATATLPDPSGYGRILRDPAGRFLGIVEEKDASPAQRALGEVNPSYYCFRAAALFDALERVDNRNAKGEYYLTDVFAILLRGGGKVEVVPAVPPEDVLSINTPGQLAEVDAVLRARLGRGREAVA